MSTPAPPSLLVFVYNADGGVLNGLKDLFVKTVSPQRYDCQLCAVTYSLTGMKREWRDFVGTLGTRAEFLHRDEWVARTGQVGVPLSAAFVMVNGEPQPWLSAGELRACTSLHDLMALVRRRLPDVGEQSG